jgi:hypothetical protein
VDDDFYSSFQLSVTQKMVGAMPPCSPRFRRSQTIPQCGDNFPMRDKIEIAETFSNNKDLEIN